MRQEALLPGAVRTPSAASTDIPGILERLNETRGMLNVEPERPEV